MAKSVKEDPNDVELDKVECVILDTVTQDLQVADKKQNESLIYKIGDIPPWYLSFFLGFQHYLTMLGGTISYPYLIAPFICIGDSDPARGYLIGTTLFVSGICTFLQCTFGIRLPIIQGSSIVFLSPVLIALEQSFTKCPDLETTTNTSQVDRDEIWMSRMREIQGGIISASFIEIFIGFSGAMAFFLNWITPLVIFPAITLVGLSLVPVAVKYAASSWSTAFGTIFLVALFAQCINEVRVPLPTYTRSKGLTVERYPIFKLFPVLIAVGLAWFICAILTVTNVLPENYPARVDIRSSIISDSPWFQVPYPGQWGYPVFKISNFVAVLAAILASIMESVGDYYACARISEAPSPPKHAINRGICVEGIGCMVAGIFGTGGGTTSFSENIGAIGITKVASRRIIQHGALLMIIFGVFGKFGALFVTIPEPIIGGMFCVMFAMISAVGLSTLQFVDLNSLRNLFVLGISIFMGMCIPMWIGTNSDAINTGNETIDQLIVVFLSASMLVGCVIGFILDNILPGTDEERGILKWKKQGVCKSNEQNSDAYEVPYVSNVCKKFKIFRYVPISPSYKN